MHVSDVVQHCLFFMKTISDNAAVFNVCTGSTVSINQLIKLLGQMSHTSIVVEKAAPRAGDIISALGDPTKAKAAGIASLVPFEAGLRALWALQ